MTELNDVNIRHIKLSTGDEIIAIVLSKEELSNLTDDVITDFLVVQRPMLIRTIERDRHVSFLFYEWQPLTDTDISCINPMHIVSHVECSNSVKAQYINVCVNDGDLDESLDTTDLPEIDPTPSETYH